MISEYFARTNTDKLSRHGYGGFYDRLFEVLTMQGAMSISVLEIGISEWREGSGHAFCACPQVSRFVGIDRKPLTVPLTGSSMFLEGDAYTEEMVARAMAYSPFDLIIDDGSHKPEDQCFFFEHYYELCHSEDVMVCEDVHQRYLDADAYRRLELLGLEFVRPSFFGGADDSNLLVLHK